MARKSIPSKGKKPPKKGNLKLSREQQTSAKRNIEKHTANMFGSFLKEREAFHKVMRS